MKFLLLLSCIHTSFAQVHRYKRIIDGSSVKIRNAPHFASIVDWNDDLEAWLPICGASLLSDIWLSSANHCFRYAAEISRKIRTGFDKFVWKKGFHKEKVLHSIDYLVPHEDYQLGTVVNQNDICLIKNSRLCPRKRDTAICNKAKKKMYLNESINELYKGFNVDSPNIKISFPNFARFRPFWLVKQSVTAGNISLNTKHENIHYIIEALLRCNLLESLKLKRSEQWPILLPRSNSVLPGTDVTIFGLGLQTMDLNDTKTPVPLGLLSGKVKVIDPSTCAENFPNVAIPQNSFCATSQKNLAGGGDSGGPVVLNSELVGIISTGSGGIIDQPDVYTNVYPYKKWIYSVSGIDEEAAYNTYCC